MKFTPRELGAISTVLQVTSDHKPRQFVLAELVIASAIFNKLKWATEKDEFIESEIEFTSEQNVFIKKLIEDFAWIVWDGEIVVPLIEKIK